MAKKLETLALLELFGVSSEEERNELARQTIRIAGKRVARMYHTDLEEHRDTTMEAAERAIKRICDWNCDRGAYSTFVALCARSTVRDHVIQMRRHRETVKTLINENKEK